MPDHRFMPVTYVSGPLDGKVNKIDYQRWELEEMLAQDYVWDYTPNAIHRDAPPVIERYQIARTESGQWEFRHIGTRDQPIMEQPITARFIGGPRDGETMTYLGSIRDRLWTATSHLPGYLLQHDGGNDPLAGWQMVPTHLTWEEIRDSNTAANGLEGSAA